MRRNHRGSSTRRPRARLFVRGLEDRLAPANFPVTTLADTGAGSLRQAITDANAAERDGGHQ